MPLPLMLPARDRRPERMDDPAIDPAALRTALTGIARLNRLSGSAAVLWPALAALARDAGRPVRVLDVATGAGDVPVALARRAVAAGLGMTFAGCDVSDTAVAHARQTAAAAGVDAEFFRHDALAAPLPTGFDVVTCSLFLHHLSEPDAVRTLAAMAAATRRLVMVNDLNRGPVSLALVWAATRLLSRSPVVHEDGPLSVRAAFTPAEVRALAARAGLTGATVTGRFPCRFLLTWSRP